MRKLIVFNSVSLDGYFVDVKGDMSWAHNTDPEFKKFVEGNAKGGGVLLFGRITYDLMVSYWPTPAAQKNNPVVAERMNNGEKIVFSRTMEKPAWNNTKLIKEDIVAAIKKMKQEPGSGLVLMGSGSIVSQFAQEGLIDEYQIVVVPVVLGGGRTMFQGIRGKIPMRLVSSRSFGNGNVFLSYEPALK
ncbi:MAG TPA: dihydrofolate reductase family protein [Candidatus Kryptonia bacterium]